MWRPVGYGLVLALLLVETFRLFGAEFLFGLAQETPVWIAIHGPLIGRALTAAVLLWDAIVLIRREGVAPAEPRSASIAGAPPWSCSGLADRARALPRRC